MVIFAQNSENPMDFVLEYAELSFNLKCEYDRIYSAEMLVFLK